MPKMEKKSSEPDKSRSNSEMSMAASQHLIQAVPSTSATGGLCKISTDCDFTWDDFTTCIYFLD